MIYKLMLLLTYGFGRNLVARSPPPPPAPKAGVCDYIARQRLFFCLLGVCDHVKVWKPRSSIPRSFHSPCDC